VNKVHARSFNAANMEGVVDKIVLTSNNLVDERGERSERRSTTIVGATAAFLIRTSSSARPRRGKGIRTTLRAMCGQKFFGGYTHARLLRAFKRRVSGWSSLAGVHEICKV
jgi:hypothetical protein